MKHFLPILFILFLTKAFGQSPTDTPIQPASIETIASIESTLKIYPNPAKSSLTINMRIPSVSQARISLHDMLGNEVELLAENASGNFDRTYDINSVRAGIYFVRINYNGQSTIVKKIIVQ